MTVIATVHATPVTAISITIATATVNVTATVTATMTQTETATATATATATETEDDCRISEVCLRDERGVRKGVPCQPNCKDDLK